MERFEEVQKTEEEAHKNPKTPMKSSIFLSTSHRSIQSVEATGGVYKGQGQYSMQFDELHLQGIPR